MDERVDLHPVDRVWMTTLHENLVGMMAPGGGSPEGLTHNLDCLKVNPSDWNCIILSHGHTDRLGQSFSMGRPCDRSALY